jgi:hypothetical protein
MIEAGDASLSLSRGEAGIFLEGSGIYGLRGGDENADFCSRCLSWWIDPVDEAAGEVAIQANPAV